MSLEVNNISMNKGVEVKRLPDDGMVRAAEFARYLGIGKSTLYKYLAEGKIEQPVRYSSRCSVWSVDYVKDVASSGFNLTGEGR